MAYNDFNMDDDDYPCPHCGNEPCDCDRQMEKEIIDGPDDAEAL